MDLLVSDAFLAFFPVFVATTALFWALRSDTGKQIDKLEERLGRRIDKLEERLGRRIDKVDETLGQRIDKGDETLGKRIDRQEERARANHAELLGMIGALVREISELKAAVSAVNAKLDERSSPRPLLVREPGGDYAIGHEPEGGHDAPEGDAADAAESMEEDRRPADPGD